MFLPPDFHDRTGNRIDTLHITSDEAKDILECLQLGKAVGNHKSLYVKKYGFYNL